jgi:hypothetical protein
MVMRHARGATEKTEAAEIRILRPLYGFTTPDKSGNIYI